MPEISFFTALQYNQSHKKSRCEFLLEKVDNYFYLGGKKAYVLQDGREGIVFSQANTSCLEKIAKITSYLTIIIPAILLITKGILRSQHHFKIIDPKEELEQGIHLTDDTVRKFIDLLPKIVNKKEDDELTWLSRSKTLVFQLPDSDLVFKMAQPYVSIFRGDKLLNPNQLIEERFANMVKAKEICLANQLGLLIIPQAKKFVISTVDGKEYTFIAEEKLAFQANESLQEESYYKFAPNLNETARQLAIFVVKTGFNDVTWRNIPLLDEGLEEDRHLALIDLEHMESRVNGFIGDPNGSRGLIKCLSEEQIEIAIAEALKSGAITKKEASEVKKARLEELEYDKQLRNYYAKRAIVTGKEPIEVDLDSLDLNLDDEIGEVKIPIWLDEDAFKWQTKRVTLRDVAEEIITEINRLIENSPGHASNKGKRCVLLETSKGALHPFCRLGSKKEVSYEENEKNLWLYRVIQALVDKGYLFKLEVNGQGYYVQA
ncbi:Uncharacterized protein PHSC3_001582 [Chlamydiales bacterium STE3]|nr:Uncharacterized protein PHSC3_001582 [Chlamydiales bacterium STE3]